MSYDLNKLGNTSVATYIRKRKNVGRAVKILQQALDKKVLAPGNIITSGAFVDMLSAAGELDKWFDRDNFRCDEHGPARACGDLLGGHGLKLRRAGKGKYIVPQTLPKVAGDMILAEAKY